MGEHERRLAAEFRKKAEQLTRTGMTMGDPANWMLAAAEAIDELEAEVARITRRLKQPNWESALIDHYRAALQKIAASEPHLEARHQSQVVKWANEALHDVD